MKRVVLLYCVLISALTSSLCAMEKYLQLSIIEKQLIAQEVQQQGKEKILTELYQEGKYSTAQEYDENNGMLFYRQSTNFNIFKTFDQKDIDTDVLTKQIFEFIRISEQGKKDRPDASWNAQLGLLGTRTQYWWLRDANDDFLPTVQIRFCPHFYSGDQKAVEEFVRSVGQELKEEKCLKLSKIERQLILQEVEKQGKEHILNEIRQERKNGPRQYDQERQIYFTIAPVALEIKRIFYKEDRATDSLTNQIFEAIEEIERLEKQGLNRPEYNYDEKVDADEYLLGERTTYQWMKDNPLAVKITSYFKARPYDQKGLERFINSYQQ